MDIERRNKERLEADRELDEARKSMRASQAMAKEAFGHLKVAVTDLKHAVNGKHEPKRRAAG